MKPKTLVILFVILCVLAGAGAFLIHSRDGHSPSGEMGAYLFENLPVNDIAAVVIKTPDSDVSLKKTADFWIVEERFGYPADFSKLSDLVRTLKEVKVGRKFDASEEVLKRLALKSPDEADGLKEERGTRIRMTDSEGKSLLDIVLGKPRTRDQQKGPPDGQYVMLREAPEIYLIDKMLSSYEKGPAEWLNKSPVKVDAEQIRKIACLGPDATTVSYAVERPDRGRDFKWIFPSTQRNIKTSSLNRLSNALSSLKIDDVEPVSAVSDFSEKDVSVRLDYTLFDGRVYHVYMGKTCSAAIPCRIRLEVDYESLETKTAGADQASQSEEKAVTAAVDATKETERLTPWIFTIPEWQHQAFFTDPEALLEKETEKTGSKSTPAG